MVRNRVTTQKELARREASQGDLAKRFGKKIWQNNLTNIILIIDLAIGFGTWIWYGWNFSKDIWRGDLASRPGKKIWQLCPALAARRAHLSVLMCPGEAGARYVNTRNEARHHHHYTDETCTCSNTCGDRNAFICIDVLWMSMLYTRIQICDQHWPLGGHIYLY